MVVEAFLACEPEFLRIRDEHDRGVEPRTEIQSPPADEEARQTAIYQRINALILGSSSRRS